VGLWLDEWISKGAVGGGGGVRDTSTREFHKVKKAMNNVRVTMIRKSETSLAGVEDKGERGTGSMRKGTTCKRLQALT